NRKSARMRTPLSIYQSPSHFISPLIILLTLPSPLTAHPFHARSGNDDDDAAPPDSTNFPATFVAATAIAVALAIALTTVVCICAHCWRPLVGRCCCRGFGGDAKQHFDDDDTNTARYYHHHHDEEQWFGSADRPHLYYGVPMPPQLLRQQQGQAQAQTQKPKAAVAVREAGRRREQRVLRRLV
ncbi:hypothetical protein F4780DRAFT_789271, partial [Xylariomycetidae sp. FL0641]